MFLDSPASIKRSKGHSFKQLELIRIEDKKITHLLQMPVVPICKSLFSVTRKETQYLLIYSLKV